MIDNGKKWIVDGRNSFLLFLQPISSFMSVVFVFNASLNDVAPVSPIWLSVDLMRMEESGLLIDSIYVLFVLYSRLRMS